MPAACQKVPLQRILGQATLSHDEVTTSFAWSRSVAHSLRRLLQSPAGRLNRVLCASQGLDHETTLRQRHARNQLQFEFALIKFEWLLTEGCLRDLADWRTLAFTCSAAMLEQHGAEDFPGGAACKTQRCTVGARISQDPLYGCS